MSITSVGSSFSQIRPEFAARGATAPAVETAETNSGTQSPSGASGASTLPSPPAPHRAAPSVADDLRALMIKAQEESTAEATAGQAARAYAGR